MDGVMARQQVPLPRGVRALLGFVCALVLVDTVFCTALTPLLPHYVHTAGLPKAGAGILVAAYPLGTLVGSLPSGVLTARLGCRAVVLLGLTLMSVSTLVFGWATTLVLLDGARFVQGLAGDGRPGGTPRGTARHRPGRGGGRRAVWPAHRGRRQPGGHRARVRRSRRGRGRPDRGHVPHAAPADRTAAVAARGLAGPAGQPGQRGPVADPAARTVVRRGGRARAAAAEPPRRLGHRHRGDVSRRGGHRVRHLPRGRAVVRPPWRAAADPARPGGGGRGQPAGPGAADGVFAGRVSGRRPALLRRPVRAGYRAVVRRGGPAATAPGAGLRPGQPGLGERAGHRRVGERGAGPGDI